VSFEEQSAEILQEYTLMPQGYTGDVMSLCFWFLCIGAEL